MALYRGYGLFGSTEADLMLGGNGGSSLNGSDGDDVIVPDGNFATVTGG